MKRIFYLLGAAMLPFGTLAFGDDAAKPAIPEESSGGQPGARLSRTMSLIGTSSESWRNPVKILFYGQSIIANPKIMEMVVSDLKKRFPYADIKAENRSIGGYEATVLWKTAEADLYPFYPDLLVLHVYSGEKSGELERIISETRRRTTADILLWTHHYDNYGERGDERDKGRDEASAWLRYIANKYGCEIADVRPVWKAYLDATKVERKSLLTDSIHLKEEGCRIIAETLLRHLVFSTNGGAPWYDSARSYDPRRALEIAPDEISFTGKPWKRFSMGVAGETPDSALRLKFSGNRVDILAAPPFDKAGSAKVLIDGKAPSEIPQAYAWTRPSSTPICWFPGLNRLSLGGNPTTEDWTLSVLDYSEKKGAAEIELTGSVSGPDGKGTVGADFVSKSGRISFLSSDFALAGAENVAKKPLPAKTELKWKTYLMGMDQYKPEPSKDFTKMPVCSVIQGLSNGEHTLELVPNGDGPVPVKEIIVYRPPLK